MSFSFRALIAVVVLVSGLPAAAHAQGKIEMKLAYYVGDQHVFSQWLIKWADTLEKRSNGQIVVKRFPGAQMGPAPEHYDLARKGIADVTWFQHGSTPGRFPLTELSNLPYLFGSAEIGTKVLNDPELRAKYLDAEHRGVKVLLLFTHQPGGVHTSKKPIRTLDDFKGMRLRFSSPTVREYIAALGGTPVGLSPTEIVEQMQKAVLDGVFLDYGGAGIAFKMAGTVKYSSEMYSYVGSFGVAVNEDFWNKLGPDLQRLFRETTTGVEKEIGEAMDSLDGPGKQALIAGGMQPVVLAPAEMAKFRKIGAEVSAARVKELEGKKLPAREVYEMMKALAQKHGPTSKSFWE